jgi:hypothetical protein
MHLLTIIFSQVERAVEQDMHSHLTRKCNDERTRKSQLEANARWSFAGPKKDKLLRQIETFESPACDAYRKYFGGRGYG